MVSLRQRELKHSNHQTSADTWLLSLSVIYDAFFLYHQPTNVSITVKQHFDYIVKIWIDWLKANYIRRDCNVMTVAYEFLFLIVCTVSSPTDALLHAVYIQLWHQNGAPWTLNLLPCICAQDCWWGSISYRYTAKSDQMQNWHITSKYFPDLLWSKVVGHLERPLVASCCKESLPLPIIFG